MEAKDSRNKRKNDLGMARRGISSMSDVEEEIDETIPVANQKIVPVRKSSEKTKKKTAVELRLERLQEFRKQKQEKKKEEEKTKKKPWRAGLRQSGFYSFPKKEATNTRRETTTGSSKASVWKVTSINRAKDPIETKETEKKMGLPKPVIPETAPQEAISEEFNQLNVQDDPKNETFDKDDESTQDEQIPEGTRIKTPTFNFRDNIDEVGNVKTPTFNFRDIVDEGGFKTPTIIISHPPEMSVKLTPKVTALLERGTNSDKRRRNCGKTPAKIPAEILQLDDVESEPEAASEIEPETVSAEIVPETVETKPASEIEPETIMAEIVPETVETKTASEIEPETIMAEIIPETVEPEAEKKDVKYFKQILDDNTKELTEKCLVWETKMESVPKTVTNYEDVYGAIFVTIGKANLLMNKKGRFEQFRSLINNCEFGLGEKETTCMDLQGFWEMIYFQVEDVNAKFSELVDLEAKNWILEQKPKPKVAPTKKAIVSKPFKPKAKASSNIKAMMAAKRKAAMMVNKENENANIQIPEIKITKNEEIPKKQEEEVKFDAGFFELASPARTALQKTDQTLSAKRKSDAHALRKSILNKRVSMSCGASPWAIINVNNSIRRSISRENTPIPLPDFEFDNVGQVSSKKLEPPRPSINLMSFDSPVTSRNPRKSLRNALTPKKIEKESEDNPVTPRNPRRSTRISLTPRFNYKESELLKNRQQGASPLLTGKIVPILPLE